MASGPLQRFAAHTELGQYRIVRLLGRGGMGEVYEAEDLENGRTLALKVLSEQLAGADDRTRFLREGRIAASISHPNAVYIFGSDEIAGTPVIAMELVPGGNLRDQVAEQGPLAPAKAVDAMLQVVAGLEAAHAAGILHRDIKPANCFASPDGVVKIGDFGLSISTVSRESSRLTSTGTFQGTPAFASPEQLWGSPLDVRSDIYSVGATLYYLLTGRPPFDDQNLMALLKQIESTAPAPAHSIRAEVPRGLSAVVAKCLAKSPAERFQDHAALEDALGRFATGAATPKLLGRRFVANAADTLILTMVVAPVQQLLELVITPAALAQLAGDTIGVAYFAIAEGMLGATIGKAALGLRVVGDSGAAPGLARGILRSLLFFAIADSFQVARLVGGDSGLAVLLGSSGFTWLLIALMFAAARRRNSYMSLYDLASGTRVVEAESGRRQARSRVATADVETSTWTERLGAYRIAPNAATTPAHTPSVIEGYDDRLARVVWIVRWVSGTPALPSSRRGLAVGGRPRWLGGRRSPGETWDAFESVHGRPLEVVPTPQPWATVRAWIADLATAMQTDDRGATTPFGPEHIWIGDDGRAWLLDWPASVMGRDVAARPASEQSFTAGALLAAVATFATKGGVPLPFRAGMAVRDLASDNTGGLKIQESLRIIISGPPAVSRMTRLAHLALVAFVPLGIGLSSQVTVLRRGLAMQLRPEVAELSAIVDRLSSLERLATTDSQRRVREALRTHIRARHAELVRRHVAGDDPVGADLIMQGWRWRLAEEVVRTLPDPSISEAVAAERIVADQLARITYYSSAARQIVSGRSLLVLVCAAGGILMAYAGRGGRGFAWLRIAVVMPDGRQVTQSRGMIRAAVAWVPAVACAVAGVVALHQLNTFRSGALVMVPPSREMWLAGVPAMVVAALAGALFIGGVIAALRRPERGWQDKIAGTWLVPR